MKKLGLAGLLMLVVFNHTFAESIFSDHGKANDYSGEYKFNPFFKTEEYQDLPPAPKLSKFDKTILGVCGSWGSVTRNINFMSILNDP